MAAPRLLWMPPTSAAVTVTPSAARPDRQCDLAQFRRGRDERTGHST
jgi:hypothetical protein